MRLSEAQRKARRESGLPCAYKAAQQFPSEKYLGKSDSAMHKEIERRRKARAYMKGLLALLALLTLAAGFYAVYGQAIQEMIRWKH